MIFFREQFTQEFKHDDGHDFDDNGGQWHLINAIRPDGPQGVAYHPQCYSDKGNYFTNTIKFGNFKVKFTQETKFQLENGPQVTFIFFALKLTCSVDLI